MAKKSRLNSISVPHPCSEDWNKMHGGEQSRFCGICEKNVYNISAMTAREANELLFENKEKVCIRMEKDAQGKIKTLKTQLHQITRQAPIAAGVLSATLVFSAAMLAQGEPVKIDSGKVSIIQTAKDAASKPAISGTVFDEQGSVVQNVQIILRNVKDNSTQKATSDRQGNYQFNNVKPSVYEVETDGDDGNRGFKKFIAKNIEVAGKNNLQLNMILQIHSFDLMGDVVIIANERPEKAADKRFSTEKNSSKLAISGVITDVSGVFVPNVKITLRNAKNNSIQKITSTNDGKYRFDNLKPSVFRIDFEAVGFKKSVFENIDVKNIDVLLNVTLEVGAIICTVDVQPDTDIQTEPAKVENKLNLIQIEQLPVVGRAFSPDLTASGKNKQSDKMSRLSLTIADLTDAVIPGAKAILINQKTKQQFSAVSNERGIANFSYIPPGKYQLRVSALGFQIQTVSLKLKKGNETKEKLNLEVGAMMGEIVIMKP